MTSTFIWYELMTPDRDAAIDFYTKVAGWTAAPHPTSQTDTGPYMVLSREGREFGGVFGFTDEMRANGMPPMWVGYIWVPDTDAAARQVEAAGGAVHRGPNDIPGIGRFAMVADPGGALFYLMTPNPREAPPPPAPEGSLPACGWHELYASQGEKAAIGFYHALFGWETIREMDMGPMGTYRIFGADGEDMGGMMDKPEQLPRSAWGFYFNVESVDAALERVTAGGGEVRMGPIEVPDGSWIIQCADPQGGVFSLRSIER